MAMTNFGTNDPLAVNLWSKSIDVEALKHTDISPSAGDDANSVIHRKTKTSTPQGERFSAPQAAIRAELIADDSCSARDDGAWFRAVGGNPSTLRPTGRKPGMHLALAHTPWDNYANKRGSHDSARPSTSRTARPQSSKIIEAGDIGESALQSPKIVKAGKVGESALQSPKIVKAGEIGGQRVAKP
jgi:hypothetical protein